MTNRRGRYHGYYLVNNNDLTESDVDFDLPKGKPSRWLCSTVIILLLVVLIFFIIVFVVVPLIFLSFESIQSSLIFTRFGLPSKTKLFEEQHLPSYKNRYVSLNDSVTRNGATLGVWQILPLNLSYEKEYNVTIIDFDEALLNSKYPVLIYFHGTGEARLNYIEKYGLFNPYFYVIAFDYRGYADSSNLPITETDIVNDCVLLYKWVRNRTKADIYVWGHSLGSAIATESVAILENNHGLFGKGLILESAFTSLKDELYVHPYVKMFTWLPWFNATILEPLRKHGLLFETGKHLARTKCPVMILHSDYDEQIPSIFGRKLYKIASKRQCDAPSVYHEYNETLHLRHNDIYSDLFTKLYIMNFLQLANNATKTNTTSSKKKTTKLTTSELSTIKIGQ